MKILFHHPPTFPSSNHNILKAFPPKWSLLNAQQKKKQMRQEKQKKRGREKVKSKSRDCCVTFKPKNYLEILLSVHAQTLQANILHLDQKASTFVFVLIIESKFLVFWFFSCLWFLLRYYVPFNKPSLFRWLHLLLVEEIFMMIWCLDSVSSHQVTTVFRAFTKISICWGLGPYCICNKKAGYLTL